jgi:hypothetical protein
MESYCAFNKAANETIRFIGGIKCRPDNFDGGMPSKRIFNVLDGIQRPKRTNPPTFQVSRRLIISPGA